MRLAPPELEISDDEGFVSEKDIFGRKELAQGLTNLVCSIEGPGVLLLDAPWGAGKSTFVKMWRGELKRRQISSVYFDAFSNDYQADAFLAIASEIVAAVEATKPKSRKALEKFKSSALSVAKVIAVSGVKIAVKAATLGAIDAGDFEDSVEEIAKDIGSEAANQIDANLKKRLESHDDDKKAFESFKQSLADLVKWLAAPHEGMEHAGGEDKIVRKVAPFIFIVDELDRCKPPFALEIIEKIKHLFSVDGVIFLLVSNLASLRGAVNHAYGDVDPLAYLEKFYHLRILLPTSNPHDNNPDVGIYLKHLGCPGAVAQHIIYFAGATPLSLRTIERINSYCQIIASSVTSRSGTPVAPYAIAAVAIAKVVSPQLYAAMRTMSATYADIEGFFKFEEWRDRYSQGKPDFIKRMESFFKMACGNEIGPTEKEYLQKELWSVNGTPATLVRYYCELADAFRFPSSTV